MIVVLAVKHIAKEVEYKTLKNVIMLNFINDILYIIFDDGRSYPYHLENLISYSIIKED